jgi:hypothetical protein
LRANPVSDAGSPQALRASRVRDKPPELLNSCFHERRKLAIPLQAKNEDAAMRICRAGDASDQCVIA